MVIVSSDFVKKFKLGTKKPPRTIFKKKYILDTVVYMCPMESEENFLQTGIYVDYNDFPLEKCSKNATLQVCLTKRTIK